MVKTGFALFGSILLILIGFVIVYNSFKDEFDPKTMSLNMKIPEDKKEHIAWARNDTTAYWARSVLNPKLIITRNDTIVEIR